VAIAAVALYAVVSLVLVFRGRLNADEGWYLYDARLVWRGRLPYGDFGFPQMPLTAYVYGLPQLVKPSLYLGRLTSLVLAVGAVTLCVRVAWREGGRIAGASVAVLCVAFPVGIYNLTLTKTYALTALLLAVTLAALTSPGRRSLTWPLACGAAVALTLTRTTGLPVALIVIGWCIVRAPDRLTRRRVVVTTGVGAVVLALFVIPDPAAARYNLFTLHSLLWHGASLGSRLDTVTTGRIPDWLGDYPGYVALFLGALGAVSVSRRVREWLADHPGVALVGLGIIGAVAAQLVSGEWAPVEYLTPFVPPLVAVSVIVIAQAVRLEERWRSPRVGLTLVIGVVALAVSTAVHPGIGEYLTNSRDAGSVAAANRVGAYLHDHTHSGDRVLTLWAQPAGLVSTRDQVQGVTVGLFSYQDLTTADAHRLHYVNTAILRRMLRDGRPAAVVVSGVDRAILGLAGTYSSRPAPTAGALSELDRHYRVAYHDVGLGVGQASTVDVYLRTGLTER
jgi:hypothetical protein